MTSKTDLPAAATAPAPARKRRVPVWLWVAGPLAVAGFFGWEWVQSAREIGTDNAYVKSDIVTVSTDVDGRVVSVEVSENQLVEQGEFGAVAAMCLAQRGAETRASSEAAGPDRQRTAGSRRLTLRLRHRSLHQGQPHPERRPLPFAAALRRNHAAVHLHDGAANREPEAEAVTVC